jgi:radical SAM superfamily enzyme
MIAASLIIKEAGIELSQYVLLGIAGGDGSIRHAEETAKVLNVMDPDFIRLRTLVLRPGAPLYDDWQAGDFTQSTPGQVLYETKTILKNLDVHSQFLSDHVSNYANINGKLPKDKKRMLAELDRTLKQLKDDSEFAAKLADPNRCAYL